MSEPESRVQRLLSELKRRRVVGVTVAYVVLGAGIIGVAADVEGALSLPGWTDTLATVLVLVGLPVTILLSWIFDLTASGVTRTPPRPSDERGAPGRQKSVVVLPFDDLSPDRGDDYFGDGLTDEIITDLSGIRALRVIARGSTMKLKDRDLAYDELAALLDVGWAVEGSVRKAGTSVRVAAHLVDLSSGSVIWGDRYEGSLEDIFGIQQSVAGAVVEALKVELSPEEEASLRSRPLPDAMAYDEYLQARPGIYAMSPEGLDRAELHLRRALECCPDSPLLLKGLGLVNYQRLNAGVSSDPSVLDETEAYADRVEELDPEGGGADLLRGLVAEYKHEDVRRGVRHLRRAYAADPDNLDARLWLSVASMSTGQTELAARLAQELTRVDPLAPFPHLFVAYAAYFQGRPEAGISALERAMELGPDVPPVWWVGVRIRVAAGDVDGAREALAHLASTHPESPFRVMSEGLLLAAEGDAEGSLALLTDETRGWAWKAGEWAQAVGDWCAEAEAHAPALEWLERSRSIGFVNHPFVAELDPHLAPLRDREDFRAYARRVLEDMEEFEAELEPVP